MFGLKYLLDKYVHSFKQLNKITLEELDENIFGKYIDIKSVHWAIENKKITDYNILVLKNTEDEVDDIISSLRIKVDNKELFISCFMILKSLCFPSDQDSYSNFAREYKKKLSKTLEFREGWNVYDPKREFKRQ